VQQRAAISLFEAIANWVRTPKGLSYIWLGLRWLNGNAKSFNSRPEYVLQHRGRTSLLHARLVPTGWKDEHGYDRRHSSLGYLPRPIMLGNAFTSAKPATHTTRAPNHGGMPTPPSWLPILGFVQAGPVEYAFDLAKSFPALNLDCV
jgi:hypothetical protein